jgi:hypothetical protein
LKNFLLRLFILCCLLYSNTTFAQNCLDEVVHNKLYSGSIDIINGTRWIYEKKYLGSPLLIENYWPKADILYKGVHYTGILMNYDVYKKEMIIFHPERGKEKFVVISNDYLSGFSFTDTAINRKRLYEYIELPGIKGKALYEKVSGSKISLFVKPVKNVAANFTGQGNGKFFTYYEYYLDTGNGFGSFRSKNQLFTLLKNHHAELSRFIRKNRLRINDKSPGDIITVIDYYNGLN